MRDFPPLLWLAIILVAAGIAVAITLPLRKRMDAIESMVEMLSKTMRGKLGKK